MAIHMPREHLQKFLNQCFGAFDKLPSLTYIIYQLAVYFKVREVNANVSLLCKLVFIIHSDESILKATRKI